MLLALAPFASASPDCTGLADVTVNELSPTTDAEFIELYNAGTAYVAVGEWVLEWGTSSWSDDFAIPAGTTIAPGAWWVVGSAGAAYKDHEQRIDLGNATSNADGVRLLCEGSAADTVIYGASNSDAWLDDTGIVALSLAPKPSDGQSLMRYPDGLDTDASEVDFHAADVPTPGAANTSGGGTSTPADCTGSELVRINEITPTTDAEFIELHNAGSSAVVLDGWVLAWGTSTFDDELEIPAGTTLAPGSWWVVGSAGAAYKDHEVRIDLGNATSNSDAARLTCDGAVIDTIVYGPDNTDAWTDDTGAVATSLADKPGSGESLMRYPDGLDTDQCGDDFHTSEAPTPGAANTDGGGSTGSADCTGSSGVKVNEFVYATDQEYVELYNAGDVAVALGGWSLEFGTSSFDKDTALPAVTLEPGAWWVIGSAGALYSDHEQEIDLGNASSNADALRVTCNGDAVDTVVYAKDGDLNEDDWLDDSGQISVSFAPAPEDGHSVQRIQDGYDTDQSALDFVGTDPTPGAANPVSEPPVCEVAGQNDVKINEFIANPRSTDAGNEWVELFNAGDVPYRLDGWTLDTATREFAVDYTFPAGTEITPGGFLVVGGSDVNEADLVDDGLSLGNGTGGDGLRLSNCEAAVVDTVLYGEAMEDGLVGDDGNSVVVADVADGASIGRYPDGEDNETVDDWATYTDPTPGEPNADPEAEGDSGDFVPPKCGERPEGGRPGGGGCTTALPLGGWEVGLALLAGLRRRRVG